jgi:hypothetical protein
MAEIKVINVEGSEYKDAVILDEYKGVYTLMAGTQGDTKTFWKMAFYKTKNGQTEKALPIKVTLGGAKAAVMMLRAFADMIESGDGGIDDGGDVPF